MLQLKLDSLLLFFGLVPNRPVAQQLVSCGSLRINGQVSVDYNYALCVNDVLQLDLQVSRDIRVLFTSAH